MGYLHFNIFNSHQLWLKLHETQLTVHGRNVCWIYEKDITSYNLICTLFLSGWRICVNLTAAASSSVGTMIKSSATRQQALARYTYIETNIFTLHWEGLAIPLCYACTDTTNTGAAETISLEFSSQSHGDLRFLSTFQKCPVTWYTSNPTPPMFFSEVALDGYHFTNHFNRSGSGKVLNLTALWLIFIAVGQKWLKVRSVRHVKTGFNNKDLCNQSVASVTVSAVDKHSNLCAC